MSFVSEALRDNDEDFTSGPIRRGTWKLQTV
jgi:hypothetical protein